MTQLYFIHGSGCDATVFDRQTAAFEGSHATTLPGHGGAGGGPQSIGEFAGAVSRDLAERGFERAILCGSSMGGAIALELGLRGDERVAAVVLLGSGARLRVAPAIFERMENDFPAAARSLAEMFFARPSPSLLDAATELMLHVGKEQTVADFRACDAFDATARLDALAVPLLAVTGERDVLTPPKFAQFLADRIPGASARILRDAGHLAMIEQPDATNDALRAFVEEIAHR